MFRKRILKLPLDLMYFIIGNIIAVIKYDKKYLTGRFFEGTARGLFRIGWKWVVKDYFSNLKLGTNIDAPWPISSRQTVIGYKNIEFHPDDINNFHSPGCYFQAIGKITIGRGTYIGPNVGIITVNHNLNKLDEHDNPKSVKIEQQCWIGMNSIILPGVVLGRNTIVGAGSVVTKSFKEGHCVVAGNPAKIIKNKI